jgi:hypothetical protein
MFVQTITAKVSDPEGVRAAAARWVDDLAPGAKGWLGETSGITDDGRLFVMARFESEEAARANSDRPEQGQWWEEFSKSLDGEATFQESTNVSVETAGDLNSAKFVQVMNGRSSNPDRSRELMEGSRELRRANRPDILGNVVIGHGEGRFTMVIYFQSEDAARAGERKEMPPVLNDTMTEMMSLSIGAPEFLDLRDPWMDSPK